MIIASVDYSINSPGICKFNLDDNLNVKSKSYLSFTQTKKFESDIKLPFEKETILYFKKDQFNNNYDQMLWMEEQINHFLNPIGLISYMAFEGYAFGANGRIFDIAEGCGYLKFAYYKLGINLRIYPPTSIKMFSTMYGNADKVRMEQEYDKDENRFDLDFLPKVIEKKSGNPKDNIVDAYFIGKLLQTELKLRRGLINLKDLNLKQIEVFNKVSHNQKENLLVMPFLSKEI